MAVVYPLNADLTFTGRTSFSDLIGGIGYRAKEGKHNLTAYVQGGMRNYGYPVFVTNNTEISLDYDSRNVGLMRYSAGYEYAITSAFFLAIEAFASHTLKSTAY